MGEPTMADAWLVVALVVVVCMGIPSEKQPGCSGARAVGHIGAPWSANAVDTISGVFEWLKHYL